METVLGRAVRMAKGIYFQAICGPVKRIVLFKQEERRTFLVVQWVRTHLPRQGIQVQSLVWEDCTCFRAAKPVCHNCWAHCSNCWSLCAWNLSFAREAAAVRRLHTTSRECSQSTQLEKVHAKQWRLSATKKKKKKKKEYNAFLNLLKSLPYWCGVDLFFVVPEKDLGATTHVWCKAWISNRAFQSHLHTSHWFLSCDPF